MARLRFSPLLSLCDQWLREIQSNQNAESLPHARVLRRKKSLRIPVAIRWNKSTCVAVKLTRRRNSMKIDRLSAMTQFFWVCHHAWQWHNLAASHAAENLFSVGVALVLPRRKITATFDSSELRVVCCLFGSNWDSLNWKLARDFHPKPEAFFYWHNGCLF